MSGGPGGHPATPSSVREGHHVHPGRVVWTSGHPPFGPAARVLVPESWLPNVAGARFSPSGFQLVVDTAEWPFSPSSKVVDRSGRSRIGCPQRSSTAGSERSATVGERGAGDAVGGSPGVRRRPVPAEVGPSAEVTGKHIPDRLVLDLSVRFADGARVRAAVVAEPATTGPTPTRPDPLRSDAWIARQCTPAGMAGPRPGREGAEQRARGWHSGEWEMIRVRAVTAATG